MSRYRPLERKIADLLESFPAVRQLARSAYHLANYVIHRQPGFSFEVLSKSSLLTPEAWAGTAAFDGEQFFGYYDKTPWSTDGTKMLMHRRPLRTRRSHSELEISLYDRSCKAVKTIGTSRAWNYQQGSMTQWLPGHRDTYVIYNDVADDHLVSHIVEVAASGNIAERLLMPIQVVHPSGKEALSLNYYRLDQLGLEYGYRVPAKNFPSHHLDDQDGIWWIDIESNRAELRLSLSELSLLHPRREMQGAKHYVNHFYYSPDGRHFVFLHRWIGPSGKFSRLYVAKSDVSQPKLLLDDRMVSHYCWRDAENLLVWARTKAKGDRYYAINIHSGDVATVAEGMLDPFGDGHPSYSPDKRWILTDSYPNKSRQRHLLLYDTHSGQIFELGRFYAPWKFDGPKRCDLHPRWSPDGNLVSVDSAHEGVRRSYILNLDKLLKDVAITIT